jgi:hypothetical protein
MSSVSRLAPVHLVNLVMHYVKCYICHPGTSTATGPMRINAHHLEASIRKGFQ